MKQFHTYYVEIKSHLSHPTKLLVKQYKKIVLLVLSVNKDIGKDEKEDHINSEHRKPQDKIGHLDVDMSVK